MSAARLELTVVRAAPITSTRRASFSSSEVFGFFFFGLDSWRGVGDLDKEGSLIVMSSKFTQLWFCPHREHLALYSLPTCPSFWKFTQNKGDFGFFPLVK